MLPLNLAAIYCPAMMRRLLTKSWKLLGMSVKYPKDSTNSGSEEEECRGIPACDSGLYQWAGLCIEAAAGAVSSAPQSLGVTGFEEETVRIQETQRTRNTDFTRMQLFLDSCG
jgi:hypothetical protein